LDLSKYCDGQLDEVYDLQSIIVHHGTGFESGHYTAFCSDDGETWFQYNDARVTVATEETLLEAEAYILFYTKRVLQMQLQFGAASEINLCSK